MNRIDQRFQQLAGTKCPAFIPYITAGDPTLAMTEEIVAALEQAGADIIELGVPFSDPVADGIVNQEAALRALKHGTSLHDIVKAVARIRQRSQIPIVLFTYFNPILAYGIQDFANDCANAGVDGVLCVDLPPEEADEHKHALDERGIATIFLIAPTSTPERIKLIAEHSTGFVYYVSRTGVTGERSDIEASVEPMLAQIRQHTNKPIAVGFGISTPAQAAEVAGFADGVIVGSAIVRLIGELGESAETPVRVGAFAKSLADAAKKGARS